MLTRCHRPGSGRGAATGRSAGSCRYAAIGQGRSRPGRSAGSCRRATTGRSGSGQGAVTPKVALGTGVLLSLAEQEMERRS
ncbi:hypothetical protein Nepgr_025569 [Nepenthes gracilis]|uniref:Uncharacterized protein n=1 Tax=Nepenthes gracilis TaxID=150966 RepID=A0AAD3T6Y3_NEPGR|nr:hypothetical protein Nepgr_025569 [Nepenthes gracilis]